MFENCDGIRLKADEIEYIGINNITTSQTFNDGYLDEYKASGNIIISIKPDAIDKPTQFSEMVDTDEEKEYHKLKNRINANDITQIHFYNDNDECVNSVYVEWHDDDEWHSRYQHQEINGEGYLVVSINKE